MAMNLEDNIPPGLKLRSTLQGSRSALTKLAWSPDGQRIACGSNDHTVYLWNASTGESLSALKGHTRVVSSAAWSPDGQTLASGSDDSTVILWNVQAGTILRTLKGHRRNITGVAWSIDWRTLASGSDDGTIRVWNTKNGKLLRILTEHTDRVLCLLWSPDGQSLASASFDLTIRLWYCDTWETITMPSQWGMWPYSGLAFNPNTPVLATLGDGDRVIHIWDLDVSTLQRRLSSIHSVQYRNAKVVLVGDSGVGKSA